MRYKKVKNKMALQENEKKMLKQVREVSDDKIENMRKQYDERVEKAKIKPTPEPREIPNPDKIKKKQKDTVLEQIKKERQRRLQKLTMKREKNRKAMEKKRLKMEQKAEKARKLKEKIEAKKFERERLRQALKARKEAEKPVDKKVTKRLERRRLLPEDSLLSVERKKIRFLETKEEEPPVPIVDERGRVLETKDEEPPPSPKLRRRKSA